MLNVLFDLCLASNFANHRDSNINLPLKADLDAKFSKLCKGCSFSFEHSDGLSLSFLL